MKLSRVLPWLLSLAPCVLVGYWYSRNGAYPRSDAGDYFRAAQTIQLGFKNSGVLQGLADLYFVRVWKEILPPNLAAPLLVLLNGNVLRTVAVAMTLYYAVFLFYCRYALRFFLSEWGACLGTLSIGLMPLFLDYGKTFNSDLPGLVFIIAALAHLLRAWDLKNRKQALAFGMWLGLGLCTRPVETLLFYLLPLMMLLVRAFRDRAIRWIDLTGCAGSLLPFVSLLGYALLKEEDTGLRGRPILFILLTGWVSGPLLLLFIFRSRLKLNRSLLAGYGIPVALASLWFLPFPYGLYNWIYESSFGAGAEISGSHGLDHFSFLAQVSRQLCGAPLLILIGIGCIAASSRWVRENRSILLAALGTALLHTLIGLSSYNRDSRYYLASAFVLLGLGAAWALRPEGRFYRLRLAATAGLGAALLFSTSPALSAFQGTDPAIPLIVELERQVSPSQSGQKVKFGVVPLEKAADVANTIDPWLLTIVARERGDDWWFDRTYIFGLGSAEELLRANNRRASYTLTGPLDGDPWLETNHQPLRLAELIHNSYLSGKLDSLGMRKLAVIQTRGRDDSRGEILVTQTIRSP